MELRNYAGALQWCDEGLGLIPTETKLQELRATADKQKVESPSRRIFFSSENVLHLRSSKMYYGYFNRINGLKWKTFQG